jgi:hypothetical protein
MIIGIEELYLLGYNAMQSAESHYTSQRNVSSCSELKGKPSNKSAPSRQQFPTASFFDF